MELASCAPYGAFICKVAARFFENLCILGVIYCCFREIYAFDSSWRWYVMRVALSCSSIGAVVLSLLGESTRTVNTVCATRYRTRWLADRCSVSQQLGALQIHTTDTFIFISHTTNVLLFKFRCSIFIGVRIIKEMPGSVASGTHCSYEYIPVAYETMHCMIWP
jgi:hypothetical protein